MKEFSNKIYVCPVDELPAAIASPFSEFDQLHSDIDIRPTLVQQEENGNTFYQFDLRTAFADAAADVVNKYRNKRPLVLLMFDTDGQHYQVGDVNYKVRAAIDSSKFVPIIRFYSQLIADPFI